MTRRIACLLVPNFPLWAELRAHPEYQGLPFAVSSGAGSRAEVLAFSPEAGAAGVCPGQSIPQARATCAELRVCVASPALDQAARDALLDIALSFSPRAILAQRGQGVFASESAVLLDAGGVASLFQSEAGFASAMVGRAESMGFPAVVSVAASRSLAQLVARQLALPTTPGGHTVQVLPAGSEDRFLAPLPIDLLAPGDELAQSLSRLGVHTAGELLRIPERALAQHLGAAALQLCARIRGREMEAEEPLPQHREATLREAMDLEFPLDRLEPLLFVLRGLLSRLVDRLALRAMGCGPLQLAWEQSGGGRDARRIGVAAPTRDLQVLLRLLSHSLESHPPSAPIESLSLTTEGQTLQSEQLDLFRPRAPSPSELGQTLSELEALCGEGRVGAPQIRDDHRPDSFGLVPFRVQNQVLRDRGEENAGDSLGRARLLPPAVRALRPPIAAQVRVERGVPTSMRSAVANGHIVHAAGPWRTTGRWWSEEERFALDHFDVQVSDGTVLRLCFDWIHKVWQVDAVYD